MRTARLVLRPRCADEMDAMMAMAADDEVMRFFTQRPGDDPAAYRAALLERVLRDEGPGLGYWSIYAREAPDEYLGWVSLNPLPDDPDMIEVGYRLVRVAWGKGYASEASRAVLDYGFSVVGLAEIFGVVHPENVLSQAVMGRLGMMRAGERPYMRGGEMRLFYRMANPRTQSLGRAG